MKTIDKPFNTNYKESLDTPIQYVKGVGPQRAEALKKLEITTIENLLYHFPREHQNRNVIPISQTQISTKSALRGEVLFIDFRRLGKNLGQARAILKDPSGTIQAIWYKRISYKFDVFGGIRKNVVVGSTIECFGAIDQGQEGKVIRVEDFNTVDTHESDSEPRRIVARYPTTNEIQEKWLRQLISRVIPSHTQNVVDPLPKSIRNQQKLPPLNTAIHQFHFPNDWVERDKARERLAFDELFFLELALELNRQNRDQISKGYSHRMTKKLLTPFKNKLGYELTKAQIRAINEIFNDMSLNKPMSRLLQGDVGSGKTVVALSAALLCIENDRQVAFLAPTEILAEQHYLTMTKFFNGLSIRFELLTGSTPKSERKKILSRLKSGKIDLIIGTHALLQEDLEFSQLGLVVIDEQHRFGVQQRAKLSRKSNSMFATDPDTLIMTATPIPRTLAMTVYGDLDVSTIQEMPPGRSPIKTWIDTEEKTVQWIREKAKEGRQIYIVFPLIDESEKLAKKSKLAIRAAKAEFDKLQRQLSEFSMALLHGQLDSATKKSVMEEFRNGQTQILVATPVIEVGVDVPNATTIAIFNPERFGLAQLHQLRGRVGRGVHKSECILVTGELQEKSQNRLLIFCSTLNGFTLAEEDLKLRGPGELLGEAQHGVPMFKVANLIKDNWLIVQSRQAAQSLVKGETALTMKEHTILNQILNRRFGHKLKLSQIG